MKLPHLWLILLALMIPHHAQAFNAPGQLLNPGFEEDQDNVGFPDGWKVAPDAKVTLTRDNPVNGAKALVIEDGYAAVSQDLNIENLANKRIVFSMGARSPDAGRLGVRIGYYVTSDTGAKKWEDAPLVWDKPLNAEFQTIAGSRVIPANALDGRFWIGIYRSQREGTVVVDDVSLEFIDSQSSLTPKEMTIAVRETGLLRGKLRRAQAQQSDNPAWAGIEKAAERILPASGEEKATQTLADILGQTQKLNAEILAALYPKKIFTASMQEPYQRLDASQLPAVPAADAPSWGVTALRGEVAALSVEVTNTTTLTQTLILNLDKLPDVDVEMRRQVFLETWYTKGETLLADPLTLLPKDNKGWHLNLEPGETTRVHVALTIAKDAKERKQSVKVSVRSGREEQMLPFDLVILPAQLPTSPQLAHYQFLYSDLNVINDLPAEAARDLEAHGVTDIEWAFMPPSTFSSDGKLLESDWSTHNRWLAGFRDSKIRLNIFWQGAYKKMKMAEGGTLGYGSKAWKRGLLELLTAYLDHAETLGVPRERFTILPMDEIHSAHLDKAPDEEPFFFRDLAQSIRNAEKKLPIYLTIGNYAFPQDIEVVLPTLHVAMPHWPMPQKLGRNAPPDYNPRKAFFEKTLPMLEKARKDGNLQIWSYHVLPGKSDDVLTMSRSYPLLAVAAGYTGFGYWAYNVTSKNSWDDQDGSILDYSVIYDGRENHPANHKYNVTSEIIVPSIQWEAIRAGQQDGQILLSLKNRLEDKNCSPKLRTEIEKLLKTAHELGGEEGYGGSALTFAAVREFSAQLRNAWDLASKTGS